MVVLADELIGSNPRELKHLKLQSQLTSSGDVWHSEAAFSFESSRSVGPKSELEQLVTSCLE